jgi:hypothetical protein
MPFVKFDPEEKQGSPFDFPKLKLRHGERARINFLQEEPLADYVHVFRAPVIINGKAETEQVEQRDGMVTRMKMAFIRQVICLGEYDVLKEKGVDSSGQCPACAASVKYSDAVPPPQRRFAANVLRYKCSPGGFAVAEPYQVEVIAWAFPQRTFDRLITLLEEQEPKNLRHHDLMLGPCENEGFQKFDIQMSAKAEWLLSEERKKLTAEVWHSGQSENLGVFLGQRRSANEISEDVQVVLLRHRQAQGLPTPEVQVGESEVDTLLDEMSSSPPAESEIPASDYPVALSEADPLRRGSDDLLKVEAAETPEAGNGEDKPVSFEDLLKDIEQK